MKSVKTNVEITLTDLIQKENQAIGDCQILALKVAKTGGKKLYNLLLEKQAYVRQLKLLRLKTNQELGNNERIAELDLLKRQKETLLNIIKQEKRGFSRFLDKYLRKQVFTKESLEEKLIDVENKMNSISQQMTEFNNTTKVTIQI